MSRLGITNALKVPLPFAERELKMALIAYKAAKKMPTFGETIIYSHLQNPVQQRTEPQSKRNNRLLLTTHDKSIRPLVFKPFAINCAREE
jgi:hypothetical protein